MSKTKIPNIVKMKLIAASGGRCQYAGCNEYLFRDGVTMRQLNKSYFAHIVGDEPDGPRGHPAQSLLLAKELSNLMLMCDAHHRLIDREDVAGHPVEVLQKMKQDHETRIETLASVQPDRKSHVVLFSAPIGSHSHPVDYESAVQAIVPESYPADSRPIELSLGNCSYEDHEPEYWKTLEDHLRRQYANKVTERLQSGDAKSLSVFAIGPQPLLILLGYLIGDIASAEIFQRHREPSGWRWQEHPDGFEFKIVRPTSFDGAPALVFSLSASVDPERINAVLGDRCSIWIVTVDQPHNDIMKSRKQAEMFRSTVRKVLNEIKLAHGEHAHLHVFPVMPVSCNIEFGRVIMPKADLGMTLYDQNRRLNGFVKTIDLVKRRSEAP